jgi:hypothetical protein
VLFNKIKNFSIFLKYKIFNPKFYQKNFLNHNKPINKNDKEKEGLSLYKMEEIIDEIKSNEEMESEESEESTEENEEKKKKTERRTGPVRRSKKGGWTEEEDEILRKAVEDHNGKNWKKIAEQLENRTGVQCLHRWQKVLNPNLVKGPWTKEEDELIIKLVEQYGPENCKKINNKREYISLKFRGKNRKTMQREVV